MVPAQGLLRFDGRDWTRVGPPVAGIAVLVFAPDGSLWLGNDRGAVRFTR
jgi:hypothetical protein